MYKILIISSYHERDKRHEFKPGLFTQIKLFNY